jgi:hypothetical protein
MIYLTRLNATMATERDTMFSGDQLHQFWEEGVIDAAGQLRKFYSMHILCSLVLVLVLAKM